MGEQNTSDLARFPRKNNNEYIFFRVEKIIPLYVKTKQASACYQVLKKVIRIEIERKVTQPHHFNDKHCRSKRFAKTDDKIFYFLILQLSQVKI